MMSRPALPVQHPKTAALLAREQFVQRSPEWFAVRRDLLTASDAASALDIKPYPTYRGSSREELLRKKIGKEAPLANAFVAHGQRYEDEARAWAMEALGETAFDVGLVRHQELPWLAASPDGVTATGKLVEIKCPLKRQIEPGVIPHHYWPQVQVQMECCDVDSTLFVQYKPAGLQRDGRALLDIVVVERDRQWFQAHRDALYACWAEFMSRRGQAGEAVDDEAYEEADDARPRCEIVDHLYEYNVHTSSSAPLPAPSSVPSPCASSSE